MTEVDRRDEEGQRRRHGKKLTRRQAEQSVCRRDHTCEQHGEQRPQSRPRYAPHRPHESDCGHQIPVQALRDVQFAAGHAGQFVAGKRVAVARKERREPWRRGVAEIHEALAAGQRDGGAEFRLAEVGHTAMSIERCHVRRGDTESQCPEQARNHQIDSRPCEPRACGLPRQTRVARARRGKAHRIQPAALTPNRFGPTVFARCSARRSR